MGVKDGFTPPFAFSVGPASFLPFPPQAKRASLTGCQSLPVPPAQGSGYLRWQVTPGPEARGVNVCLPHTLLPLRVCSRTEFSSETEVAWMTDGGVGPADHQET